MSAADERSQDSRHDVASGWHRLAQVVRHTVDWVGYACAKTR